MKHYALCIGLAALSLTAQAQLRNDDIWKTDMADNEFTRDILHFPNVDGYKTLKCDFHVHTMFSDGKVWPSARVDEAWTQGYDAIAITDHIEYRPHQQYLNADHNTSYAIARERGDQIGMLVIKGSEITRSKPLGHLNALFLKDSNPLDTINELQAIENARAQGAVILWNHPGWPDNKSTLYSVHDTLLREKKIDMVEVHNFSEYYPLVFDWIDQYNIAPTANSDIHEIATVTYGNERMRRPITLVFATDCTEEAIKEALLARRTAAVFNDKIMATKAWAEKLVMASVRYRIVSQDEKGVTVEIENLSDVPFVVKKGDDITPVTIPAMKAVRTTFAFPVKATLLNVFIGHNKNLELTF